MLVGKALKTFLFNILVIERNKLFISPSTISLFVWETRLGKGSFQIEVLTLVQNITENRIRHARGPVHLHWVRYMHTTPLLSVSGCTPGHQSDRGAWYFVWWNWPGQTQWGVDQAAGEGSREQVGHLQGRRRLQTRRSGTSGMTSYTVGTRIRTGLSSIQNSDR